MIGVLGATGRVGRHIIAGLAERGVDARALVRRPDADLPLPAVHAGLAAPATLPDALHGVDRLLLLTPHGPDQDLHELAAVDAATTAGVERIVKISGGAPSLGPNGPTSTAVAHWRSEQRIEQSGLRFVFLRPAFYMQNLRDTVAPIVARTGILAAPFGTAPIAMVDVRDVAACAIAALLDDHAVDRAWQLTGPRPVTFETIAAHIGARHLKVPITATRRAMQRRGLAAFEVDHATRMAAYFAAGSDGAATDHVLRLTGAPPLGRSVPRRAPERFLTHDGPRPCPAPYHHHQGTPLIMVTRIGHIALHVSDLDPAVEFQQQVIGMVETDRVAGASYLTCNERHHELILIEDPVNRAYEHLALEVADASVLETAAARLTAAGGTMLGGIYDGEPGIDRALKVSSPGGHVYKLFCGMESGEAPPPGDRPVKFEHISCKVANHRAEERFLTEGLGLRFSDRMGFLASWWHCNEDHHGIALTLAPRSELSHYAYQWSDLAALGRVADRLKALRGRKCIWGPSRHGPGNNHFLYLHDQDGAMIECCSEIAQMTADGYQPKNWSMAPGTINQWGGPPPLRFLLTGFPIAEPRPGRPAWAMRTERTPSSADA